MINPIFPEILDWARNEMFEVPTRQQLRDMAEGCKYYFGLNDEDGEKFLRYMESKVVTKS